jgi:hypothetical protein
MVGFIRSSNSSNSCRRRLAQGANTSFSNSARPCSLHSFFFQRLPFVHRQRLQPHRRVERRTRRISSPRSLPGLAVKPTGLRSAFETGRKHKLNLLRSREGCGNKWKSGSIWNRNHGREANTRGEELERIYTRAPPKRVGRAFALLTKTYHGSPSVVSEARGGKGRARARCVRALSIQRLEGSRPRLRRTRALCKFNGRKERCRGAPRLCCSAPSMTSCAKRSAKTKEHLEERG